MATDFFHQQDAARRQTRRLIVLFVLAVVLIVLAIYGVATMLTAAAAPPGEPAPPAFDAARLALVTTIVLLVITSGSLFKILMLRDGGNSIAQMLGGRLIDPGSADQAGRRLLNVVEEMALAAGTPVPPVYILDNEHGINAFAAGFTPADAVIAVSRGALDHLTRDELQGVVGHEFSHILNGDMRLNLRLIGLVHGIVFISLIGQIMFRSVAHGTYRVSGRDRDDRGGAVVAILIAGLALFVIGLVGVLLGRIIKCAISRQREFLADASSVQFTRNPDGIAGALKKIGGLAEGSRIENSNAEQACHMFFGQGVPSLAQLLATHPPLAERIRRLDPSFDGRFPPVRDVPDADEADRLVSAFSGPARPSTHTAEEAMASIGSPTPDDVDYASALIGTLTPDLVAAAHEPFSARAVVYSVLLDADPAIRRAQLGELDARAEPGTVPEVLRLLPRVEGLEGDKRISLVDLTFPALLRLSDAQYRMFRGTIDALVAADRRVSLFEYTLQRMLVRHLDRVFFRLGPPRVRFLSLDPVFGDALVLVSAIAWVGQSEGTAAERAFALGMAGLQENHAGERSVALLPPERCTLADVDRALGRLAQAAPAVKKRVLDACAASIAADGFVIPGEGELLRAISDSLDCPMPPLLSPRTGSVPPFAPDPSVRLPSAGRS
jgi:Zn-dependent protease with chaperone function